MLEETTLQTVLGISEFCRRTVGATAVIANPARSRLHRSSSAHKRECEREFIRFGCKLQPVVSCKRRPSHQPELWLASHFCGAGGRFEPNVSGWNRGNDIKISDEQMTSSRLCDVRRRRSIRLFRENGTALHGTTWHGMEANNNASHCWLMLRQLPLVGSLRGEAACAKACGGGWSGTVPRSLQLLICPTKRSIGVRDEQRRYGDQTRTFYANPHSLLRSFSPNFEKNGDRSLALFD